MPRPRTRPVRPMPWHKQLEAHLANRKAMKAAEFPGKGIDPVPHFAPSDASAPAPFSLPVGDASLPLPVFDYGTLREDCALTEYAQTSVFHDDGERWQVIELLQLNDGEHNGGWYRVDVTTPLDASECMSVHDVPNAARAPVFASREYATWDEAKRAYFACVSHYL